MIDPVAVLVAALTILVIVWAVNRRRRRTAPAPTGGVTYGPPVKVKWIFDGDTVKVKEATGREFRVRLIGVDAPEVASRYTGKPSDPFGNEARAYAIGLLKGATVRLGIDPSRPYLDRWGRNLYYVQLPDGSDLGERLLFFGLAREMTFTHEGPYAYRDHYLTVQADAQAHRRGMWSSR